MSPLQRLSERGSIQTLARARLSAASSFVMDPEEATPEDIDAYFVSFREVKAGADATRRRLADPRDKGVEHLCGGYAHNRHGVEHGVRGEHEQHSCARLG